MPIYGTTTPSVDVSKHPHRTFNFKELNVRIGIVIIIIVGVFLWEIHSINSRKFPPMRMHGIRQELPREPCPMCGEKIRPEAKICPYCRSELTSH